MKGQECPPQINKTRLLSFEDWNEDLFKSLPEWIQEKIKTSDEYKMRQEPSMAAHNDDNDELSDMPF